jgi:2-dehydropantoate 2-reductase
VVLCGARAPEQITVVRDESVRTTSVGVCLDKSASSPAGLVVFAVKRQDAASAAAEWASLVGKGSIVLRARNGIEENPIDPVGGLGAAHRGDETTAPRVYECVTQFGVTRLAAGVVLRTAGDRLLVPPDAALLAGYFAADTVRVEPVDDFRAEQWRKFAVNVCAGGLTTLFGEGLGIFRDPFVRVIARAVLEEVGAVAAADGTELDATFPDRVLADLAARSVDGTTSLLRDARAGRPLELDAHSAGLVRIADGFGIPVPVNARMAAALAAPRRRRYEELVA